MIAAVLLTVSVCADAQTQVEKGAELEGPYLEEDPAPETPDETVRQAAGNVGADVQAQWYVGMDYAGFEFELPSGMIVQNAAGFIAKYPDGTFGISMSKEEKGSNQKHAYEVCRRLAASMSMPDARVEKVSYGKCGGAIATGHVEGQEVTVLVLPYRDQEVTSVMLASPERKEWAEHFLGTLKR